MYYDKKQKVTIIDEDDQCYSCTYFTQGIACPLLEALGLKIVKQVVDPCVVKNCGFYVQFERKLSLIKKPE